MVAAVLLLTLVVSGGPARATPAVRTVPPEETEGDDPALHLLRVASVASREQTYSGVRFVTTWGPSGTASWLVEVDNRPGSGLMVHRLEPGGGRRERVDPGAPGGGMVAPPEGMLEVLARNYRVVAGGDGAVCGRDSTVVHVLRRDGTPAARFWVDKIGGIVLRREILDGRGGLAHASAFIDLRLPAPRELDRLPEAETGSGGSRTGVDRAAAADARARGWRFPDALPGGLTLFRASVEREGHLYLGYSDGLSVLSVFVQPGRLAEERLHGWRSLHRYGHTIWSRDSGGREAIWTSGGHVYSVFADAPADMVDAAVAALPHEPPPGLWQRLGKGAARLLSWANPFA
jgi:hypothetical protein